MTVETIPFLSIIVPTYNRGKLIARTIESVKNQTCLDYELVIVDDGSKDNTSIVVKPYLSKSIKYFKKENGERGAARNYGVSRSTGRYITFLDSDDILYSNHIDVARQFTYDHPEVSIFHSGYDISNTSGEIISSQNCIGKNINHELLRGNILSCIGVFIKREVALTFPFNENRALSGSEDWELWMRMACHHDFVCTEKVTACMIQHDSRSVISINSEAIIKRIHLAYDIVTAYAPFLEKYGTSSSKVKAHLFLYLSLHLMINRSKTTALKYLRQAIQIHPSVLFTKKAAGVVKAWVSTS